MNKIFEFKGNFILKGKIECITGLHIGGSKDKLEIGGVFFNQDVWSKKELKKTIETFEKKISEYVENRDPKYILNIIFKEDTKEKLITRSGESYIVNLPFKVN